MMRKMIRMLPAFLCVVLLFFSVGCGNAAGDAAAADGNASGKSRLYGAPSVVLYLDGAGALDDAAALRKHPASVIMTIDDRLSVVTSGGEVLGTFDDIFGRVRSLALPVVSVRTEKAAEAFVSACGALDTEDMAVLSQDADVLSCLRANFPHVRGILDCTGRDLGDKAEIVRESNVAMAGILMLSQAQSDPDTVRYFQSRMKTVWTKLDDGADSFDALDTALSGCYGLVARDCTPICEAYALCQDNSQRQGTGEKPSVTRFSLNIAHRGLPHSYAENTVEGVVAAAAAGATHVEVDAHLSGDGEIVIMHDADLSRTTDYAGDGGRIADMTLADIRQYGVCRTIWGEKVAPCRIPTAEDIFASLRDTSVVILFEIKSTEPLLVLKLRQLIERYDFWDRVVVISFSASVLEEMHRTLPEIPTASLSGFSPENFESTGRRYNAVNAAASLPKQYFADASYLENTLGDRGYMSYAWTAGNAEECRALSAGGVYGITNNAADDYGEEICRIEGKAGQRLTAREREVGSLVPLVVTAYNGKQKTVYGTVAAIRCTEGGAEIIAAYEQSDRIVYTRAFFVENERGPGRSAVIGGVTALSLCCVAVLAVWLSEKNRRRCR